MKAIGKKINNQIIEFDFKSNIYCFYNELIELKIPNGTKNVYCYNNQLTELILPNGIEIVYCHNNPIKEITLPISITYALLPLNCIVLNIEQFRNRTDVTIKFI